MNTATLTRVLQRSMYVLKIANASRNHATAFGTLLGFAVNDSGIAIPVNAALVALPAARQVVIAEEVARYTVRLVAASRPGNPGAPDFIDKWVKWGAGLRGSQALVRGAKARALIHGRYHVAIKDIQALAKPILRHRIMTNFYAESERVNSDAIIDRLIEAVPLPKSGM